MAKLEIEIKAERTIYCYILILILKVKIKSLYRWFISNYSDRIAIKIYSVKTIKPITIGDFIYLIYNRLSCD